MKIPTLSLRAPLAITALALFSVLALPGPAMAKPDKKGSSSSYRSKSSKSRSHDRERDYDRDHNRGDDRSRIYYHSRPRTSFTLSLGNGYAGRGYYYGPAGVPYYYRRPEVRYYRTRELAPREYWGSSYRTVSLGASVQQALARRGFYRGPIDGQIGPYSRQAIARYQASRGLRPTGVISASLLRSLGLQ